jgi:negative regulator of genetic competence, sporulation and motility
MQIDVLSQNTLKLTLSRLDMFDLDIKYESLSGKNPDTRRLLSHVLRTVKLDKSATVDFSGERLFVEAFPRPDGGCMLYISCLTEDGKGGINVEKKAMRISSKSPSSRRMCSKTDCFKPFSSAGNAPKTETAEILCHFNSLKELEGACKNLSWQHSHGKIDFASTLYGSHGGSGQFRLLISGDNQKLITSIVSEYGELLGERESTFTFEHFNPLITDVAVEKIAALA